MIKVYEQKVIPKLIGCHPIPPLQAGLYNMFTSSYIRRILKSRDVIFTPKSLPNTKLQLYIVQTTRIKQYVVDEAGLVGEDKHVLGTAFHAVRGGETFLVTLDTHFLNLETKRISRAHPNQDAKLKIATPDNPPTTRLLKGLKQQNTSRIYHTQRAKHNPHGNSNNYHNPIRNDKNANH